MKSSAFFKAYQAIGPLIFFPMSIWLWINRYDDVMWLSVFGLFAPIVFSTVIPFLGIRILNIWELKSKLSSKGFRPHHGLFFGTATSLFALLCLPVDTAPTLGEMFRAGFVLTMTIGFINWFYDVFAIKAGMLAVYNKPYSEGASEEAIAMQYAPALFGGFGLVYGFSLRWAEHVAQTDPSAAMICMVYAVTLVASVAVPLGLSEIYHFLTVKESGFISYKPTEPEIS